MTSIGVVQNQRGYIFEDKVTSLPDRGNSYLRKIRCATAGIHDHIIMKITGHKTREMFERYDTIDEMDILCAADVERQES